MSSLETASDIRKDFILATTVNYFGLRNSQQENTAFLRNNKDLNNFLDDGSCFVLSTTVEKTASGDALQFGTQIVPCEGKNQNLVFFKVSPEVITSENLHQNIFISSMVDSPITMLYHAVQRLFAPTILKDNAWSEKVDPKLQDMLTQLESGLKSIVHKQDNTGRSPTDNSENLFVVMTPMEEIELWSNAANSAASKSERDKAASFWNAMEPLAKYLSSLETVSLSDIDEVIETAHNTLDDLWKLEDFIYPQQRMEHFMVIIGNAITRYIQLKLKSMNFWTDLFMPVEEALNQSINACEKWDVTCTRLTSLFWSNYSHHRWKGKPFASECIKNFGKRLREILHLRTLHRQLTRLLSVKEQEELNTADTFQPFAGLNPLQYNAYTEPVWRMAVTQFERCLVPTEDRVAGKLKSQLRNINRNTLQLLQEFKRYEDLIQRPNVRGALVAERENLLGQLREYINQVNADFNSGQDRKNVKLDDMPQVIRNIYWVRQMECKINDIEKTSAKILNDLNGYEGLHKSAQGVLKDLKEYHSDQFDSWSRDVGADIQNNKLSLRTNDPVVKFEQGKLMHVNYSLRLVGLIREVRQLAVLGYKIPIKIQQVSNLAKQFMKQAKALQQIANFHNTIGDRMIPSQRPMMLEAALKLAELVDEQNGVTWSDTKAVDRYISKLQTAVERLSRENNKLASYHLQIRDKVDLLMNTDLLRHQQKWKEVLKDIRNMMGQLEEQKFTNMKSWRLYWDQELYKALEHQYQLSLSSLNEHLPEINVDLVYRQQCLQFQPSMEDIRVKYYAQLKRFISLPKTFRGVSESNETSIFPPMVKRNAHLFDEVNRRGEELLERLDDVKKRWVKWVSLGSVNLDQMADENLHTAEDWDSNFRASKVLGQDIAKLPCTEEKLECFLVSFLPVRSEIELHNRRYWDVLASSLQTSILKDVAAVEKFVEESTENLSRQPRTVVEIGEANVRHAQTIAALPKMRETFDGAVRKNNTLASWTKGRIEQVARLASTWDNFQTTLDNHQYLIGRQVESIKTSLLAQVENMSGEVDKFSLRWEQVKPRETSLMDGGPDVLLKSLEVLRAKRAEWETLVQTKDKLAMDCSNFGIESVEFQQCDEIESDLKKYEAMWALYEEFDSGIEGMSKEEWIICRSKSYKFEEFLHNWQQKLSSSSETTSITVRLLQEVEKYKVIVPNWKYIRGDMFSDKHWLELFAIIRIPSKSVESLTLGDFLSAKETIAAKASELEDLNSRASSEIVIRQALGELDIWEVEAKFGLVQHTDSQGKIVMLINDFKDVLNKVGDNQCLLQSIKNSPNYESFIDRAAIWETRLADLDEFLHNLNEIQRKWVYLEPIFGVGTLSQDRPRFHRVDQDFRFIMSDIAGDNRVVSLCKISNLHQMLNTLRDQLARCQKSLNDFLEEKRSVFPRFYFLGDDDLLEILGQSTKIKVIQAHMKKLFAGIHSVLFDTEGKQITAIKSLEGETVYLKHPIVITQQVEEWLSKLSAEMKSTLSQLLTECSNDARRNNAGPDPLKYPSQILCLSESVSFTQKCEEAIVGGNLQTLLTMLKAQLDVYTRLEVEWSDGDGDGDSSVLELKLKALLLDTIHHVSIVEQLILAAVTSIEAWHWQRQLRFYIRARDGAVVVRMVDAEFEYTYEYQGNAAKLVHTPLTDKCYLTLTQGMHMGLGGNPYGPAGTGKTESVKALGGFLGRQVLVFNCDEGIDVKSMARIFVGLVKCGAWGCFDEFNRLEEATLSAISMQIQPIQTAIKNKHATVKLLDVDVPMDPSCGIFVTLNPAGKGYGGRQKLPDNLKQLFRPVVMSQPDNEIIAEVILYCEGFKHAKAIGRKLVEVFDLSRKLLTKQQHYDWGLRALKTVLGGCGSILKSTRKFLLEEKVSTFNLKTQGEMELVVQALRLNTLSKLTFTDCLRFDDLVKDVFPGIPFTRNSLGDLDNALKESYIELGLLLDDNQMRKCLELYEQLQQRMGVVIVGPSGSGKTTLCRILKHALGKMNRTVKQHTINPKAMPRTQLLGHIDLDTRQWTDGVLTLSAQQVYAEPPDVHSWIVCDGDVDPEWIESLNSVLDDNRLLTLPSGWRIQFGPNVNFVFETHDLSYASPATVSRMGMIFLSDEDINVKGIVTAWLQTQPESLSPLIGQLIDDYFYKGVQWVTANGEYVVPTSLVGVVQNGLSQLPGVTSKAHFTVALVSGLGGNLSPASRETFAKLVFEWTGEFAPDAGRILFSFYNARRDCVDTYSMDQHDLPAAGEGNVLPLVMTADVQRTVDVIQPWMRSESQQPFLLVGPQGCGKSLILNHCFSKLRSTEVATIHCSAQITPQHVLQKLGQVCMIISSNTGRVYRPKNCENLILYFKDLNLARPDKWGTSMLIAFLQQVVTYRGFYDNNLEWVGLEKVQIVGSMVAGNSMGRHSLTTRFTSITRIYSISYPEKDELSSIYNLYLSHVINLSVSKHPVWKIPSKVSSLSHTMINIYDEVKATFTPMNHNHYLFTPRDLTRWCLGLLRYDLNDDKQTADHVLLIVVYEAMRLLRDKLVGHEECRKFDMIVVRVIESDWSRDQILEKLEGVYFVSGTGEITSAGAPLPTFGKSMSKIRESDWTSTVEQGIIQFGRESQSLDLLVFPEVLSMVASIDRALSAPGGSLLLAGRAGVGRKSAVRIVSALHGARLVTLKMGNGYSLKNFKNDLKSVMQVAGVEGEQVYFLLEDHQLINISFLDMINSLLSSGEVPGLYNMEELEPIASPLRDAASQEGFVGSPTAFFAGRVQKNLHVVLIMDVTNPTFTVTCESNPALYKQCCVHWLDGWSKHSMQLVPRLLLAKDHSGGSEGAPRKQSATHSGNDSLISGFLKIHEQASSELSTPRRYIAFIHMYIEIYNAKKSGIEERQKRLQAGVSKLTEARQVVDTLKSQAAGQEDKLAEKQAKANSALQMITETMRNANTHKGEMEVLKEQTEKENQQLMIRKREIDAELSEIEPLIQEASAAVGNIKSESLSEIRSLRAPPDVIRDILEGVLRLMGILDTSWNSMKNFLAKRGIKEEIRTFDAHAISTESRLAVEKLLVDRRESFEPRNAKRASTAAAPLASWVTANVKYAKVLEKIRPLEREQKKLQDNMKLAHDQIGHLSTGLTDVDKAVAELKNQLTTYTKEGAEIEIHLNKAKETINAAEGLIGKLNDEYLRWKTQLSELSDSVAELPFNSLLAAAFITYLSATPENVRKSQVTEWQDLLGVKQEFCLNKFLGSEKEQLHWLSEGLPSDQLSIQNALIILQIAKLDAGTSLRPFLIDPSSLASEWLKKHLRNETVEVISQHSERFTTTVELAIRFGKVLIVQEVDSISPVLFPVLRGDLISQGPRKVVQVGDKLVGYNDKFQLYLTTRAAAPVIPPDAAAVVTFVNFTTTWAGLTGQLLACALRQERPELEQGRGELLRKEEELKLKLDSLQEILLQELAAAQGDILQNKDLLQSLNETKASSAAIYQSLEESSRLQADLNKECDVYLPLAEFGSTFYFVIADLGKVNNMYQFSVGAFTRLFQNALASPQDGESVEQRTKSHQSRLQYLIYQFVGRSLFKADRLTFALHIVYKMHPKLIQENEWETITGQSHSDIKVDSSKMREQIPSWIEDERVFDVFLLKNSLPHLYADLQLEDSATWSGFHRAGDCETSFPTHAARKLTPFQQVLAVQALRPDRLHSALTKFSMQALGLRDISPPALSLKKLLNETMASEPILLVISPGADPSEEVRALAETVVGNQNYHEVAMGQGQVSVALESLALAARQGHWLCLKNLHLMTYWLPALEMELSTLVPHTDFRLWLTAEAHPRFSPILAQSCLKVTYEAPQGVKKNLLRTYTAWGPEHVTREGGVLKAQALFALAWFHAVVQERRTYIPQGWAKFYEFSDADLRASEQIISRLFAKGTGNVRWEFVHGLCENAIYGGRVDNVYDIRVLASYLREFFNIAVLTQNKKSLGPIVVPTSTDFKDYSNAILQLSDNDKPSYFGLPANVERSWQRIASQEAIGKLRALMRKVEGVTKFDRDEWQTLLSPILNLWKKLNQGLNLIQTKLPAKRKGSDRSADPVCLFVEQEFQSALALILHVHKTLGGISKVIRGTILPSADNLQLADEIIGHQTPSTWLKLWDGPADPLIYLRSLVSHSLAIEQWFQRSELLLTDTLDLSVLFHPETFLSALKQQTSRDYKVPIDELHLSCSWTRGGVVGAKLPVTITGLQLEGAVLDGQRLVANEADSPSISVPPPCTVAWLPKAAGIERDESTTISLPLYYTSGRESVVASLDVPCSGSHDKWIQSGAVFFLKA